MGTNPAWVPGNSPTPPASVRSARDIAAGLRALETASQTRDPAGSLNHELIIGRLLGPGVGQLIRDLQDEGKLPPFGTLEWNGMIELAERGQVSIAPVILIGPKAYACDVLVHERIRHGGDRGPGVQDEDVARPVPAARPPAPVKTPVSLADEIGSWG